MGNLSALEDLTLVGNPLLSGTIPASLGTLKALQSLYLGSDNLSGSIPVELSNLSALKYLSLDYNQLSGSVPIELANLKIYLTLDNNKFTSLPAFSHTFNRLSVKNNQLTFESLEPNFSQFKRKNDYFPQDSVGIAANLLLIAGQSTQLSALVGGTNNLYQWTKNGINITGATNANLTVTKAGTYGCKITNTVVTGLTLYRRLVRVSDGLSSVIASDSLALVDLYNNTQGAGWWNNANRNWLIGPVNTWSNVTVDDRRVTSVVLPDNNLIGSIPKSLGNLSALVRLNLNANQLSGSIPVELSKLTALKALHLANNHLSGSIPAGLGNLMALQELALNQNQLSGNIPIELASLTALKSLDLRANLLTGNIPAELDKLTALTVLALYDNQLSGNIPASLFKLTALQYLDLSYNQLTGNIPVEVGNLKALEYLSLGLNRLSGSLPASLGNLSSLEYLELGANLLTGSIPAELGNLQILKALDLFDNQLSGSIPASLGKLASLQSLNLRHNQLSGNIPLSIGNLAGLYNLGLDSNQFISLPPFISSFTHLSDPYGDLIGFYAQNNRLTFESLEANFSKFKNASQYSPQDSVLSAANIVLTAGQSTQLSALVGGANNRYQWTKNGADISGATNATLTVTEAGTYGCKITNTVVTGLTLNRRQVKVSVNNAPVCQATGTILREVWTNLSGSRITDIPLLSTPNQSSQLTSLQAPNNFGDRYGQRLRGYICAPQTGAYTFWIVSDNDAQLYLSTDADPSHKQAIAAIQNGFALPGQWTKYASQKSATIQLVAGQRYYLEAIHKEEYGGDNLIIGWRTPASAANATPVVVPGSVLSPFIPTTCTATGTILREYWANVTGTSVAAIPVNTPPTSTSQMTSFQGPLPAAGQYGVGDNYGTRYRGYVCAPSTGNYTFWLASDNDGELWLSTDNNPNNKVKLAYIQNGFVYANQWTKYPSQQSVVISLVAGKTYYIEALQKEASGGDQLQVGWRLPTSAANASPVVIPGSVLSPFVPASAARNSAEYSTEAEAASPRLKVFPNPSSGKVFVNFTTTATEHASLNMYNMWGGLVQPLFEGTAEAGEENRVEMDGQQFATGMYIIRLTTPNKVDFKKIILMK